MTHGKDPGPRVFFVAHKLGGRVPTQKTQPFRRPGASSVGRCRRLHALRPFDSPGGWVLVFTAVNGAVGVWEFQFFGGV